MNEFKRIEQINHLLDVETIRAEPKQKCFKRDPHKKTLIQKPNSRTKQGEPNPKPDTARVGDYPGHLRKRPRPVKRQFTPECLHKNIRGLKIENISPILDV